MDNNPCNPSRADQKTMEKNRRNQMKILHTMLNSLLPHDISREVTSLPDQLHEATNYIKKLQMNVQRLNEEKDSLMRIERKCLSSSSSRVMKTDVQQVGSALELVLTTGLDRQFMFNEAIRMLHEEGVEILNASFSVAQDNVFHTIHAKIGESNSSYRIARIFEGLKKFCHSDVSK